MASKGNKENWIGLLTFGFFILLLASFFVINPEYWSKILGFLESFELRKIVGVPILPHPTGSHSEVYQAITHFCLVFGLFQFFVLALRFFIKSSLSKISETASNIVFWLGASFVFNILLAEGTIWWFNCIGGIIAVLGFSIIVRSLITIFFWRINH
jgi:hypothetical protein